MWASGKVASDHVPLPQPPQGVDLRLSLGSFSFTFLLAGLGTPRLESTRGKSGKPQLIRSLCLDCSRCLLSCVLHPSTRTRWRYRIGGGVLVVVEQQWNFFPKAYAPGPSQLWLCSGTLLPSSCGPGRPAFLTKTSILSGTVRRVFPLLSSHSSPEFSSLSSPCRVGQLAGPPASLSKSSASKGLQCISLRAAGTLSGQDLGEQPGSGCPRPIAELNEDGILLCLEG